MEKKLSKAPKILGIAGLVCSFIAMILMMPIIRILMYKGDPLTFISRFALPQIVEQIQVFSISLILPMALLLIPRENGRKKAMVFTVISALVILSQLLGNIVFVVINEGQLHEVIYYFNNYFIGSIHGVTLLSTLLNFIEGLAEGISFASIIERICALTSNALYLLQPVLCLIGFITLLKKKKTTE